MELLCLGHYLLEDLNLTTYLDSLLLILPSGNNNIQSERVNRQIKTFIRTRFYTQGIKVPFNPLMIRHSYTKWAKCHEINFPLLFTKKPCRSCPSSQVLFSIFQCIPEKSWRPKAAYSGLLACQIKDLTNNVELIRMMNMILLECRPVLS